MAFDDEIVLESSEDTDEGEFSQLAPASDKKHSISGLTQFTEGQKLHPGIPRDFLGTFDGWDYLQSIRDNAKARNYEWLMVERRRNGRVYGSAILVHLKSKVETLELGSPTRPQYTTQPQSEEAARLARIEEVLGIRTPRRFRSTRMHAPRRPRQASAPPQPAQPTFAELMALVREERRATEESMTRLLSARENPQKPPDPFEFANRTFEGVSSLIQNTQRLLPQQGERSIFDKVIDGVDRAMEHVPKLLPFFVQGLKAAQAAKTGQPIAETPAPVVQPQATAQPTPEESEEEQPLTFDVVISNIANDIINNNKPRDAVDEIVRLVAAQPELLPVVATLMVTPTDELIGQLSAATSSNLSVLSNAQPYVEKLKSDVQKRIQLPQPYGPVLDGEQQIA